VLQRAAVRHPLGVLARRLHQPGVNRYCIKPGFRSLFVHSVNDALLGHADGLLSVAASATRLAEQK
jgi:hypothetical protein